MKAQSRQGVSTPTIASLTGRSYVSLGAGKGGLTPTPKSRLSCCSLERSISLTVTNSLIDSGKPLRAGELSDERVKEGLGVGQLSGRHSR
jgi:hypothetical protein